MFELFDLNIISIFLSRFNAKKILLIGLSNEIILNKLITYSVNNNCMLYTIDNEINIEDLINKGNFLKDNIKHFKGQGLNILKNIKDFDVVLINDDPNWYTIFNELNLIKENSLNFPLVFVCNNKYPHKRRDSYINPDNIPIEFKHECCNKLPIKYEENNEIKHAMIDDGFCHAIYKDTPKNGVLTAIEDFLNENAFLKMLEINFLEGITLIYDDSINTVNKINEIINEEKMFTYSNAELSDQIIENNLLLKYVSKFKFNNDYAEGMKLKMKQKDEQLESYKVKIESQNTQIDSIRNQVSLKETELQNVKSELNIANSVNEQNIQLNKEKDEQLESYKVKIESQNTQIDSIRNQVSLKETELQNVKSEQENKINNLKQESMNQLSKIEQKEYCLACFKEEILNNQLEINYLKNYSLTKKILNPFSYIYLLLKSPKEIRINFKLYKALKDSSCFDIGFYLKNNEDLIESKWCKYFSPELHYVCNGFDEKRLFNKKYFNRKSKKELLNYLLTCNE